MNSGSKAASPYFYPGLAALIAFSSGCAGGGLLDRSIVDAELPAHSSATPYPTAVRNATNQPDASQQPSPVAGSPSPHRNNPPHPLTTPLAVIPPELVRATSAAARPVAASMIDSRQTLVDLTPATNWAPPSVAQSVEGDKTNASASNTLASAASKHLHIADANEVVKAGTETAIKGDLSSDRRQQVEQARTSLIEALDAEIKQRRAESTTDEELPRLEQQLRLAYVSAGRLDDAVAGVESLDPTQREAYKNLMFGLGVWLSPDESRRPPLRSAKVLHSLRDATTDLAAAGKLEVKNLVFCERVDHFGWYSEFPRKEFQPRQQVILYAEVENFSAEHKGGAGFETELQGSYVIMDSSGQEVATRQLQLDKEVCRNHRRDYFLAYRIYMPEGISPGR
ncbi:MAG TPA: hypothetical protein VGI40_03725, partial [Pirellulaceae bacterium]